MKETIECAYCDGQAQLQKQGRTLEYKKETFFVVEHFYKCLKCAEEFTTTESDTLTLAQAHNQYREKYSILFPEELTQVREQYELSGASMALVLGMGTNSYTIYEHGEMPTLALSNLMKSAANVSFFSELLSAAKSKIPSSAFEKASNAVQRLLTSTIDFNGHRLKVHNASEYTGYRRTSVGRIGNLLSYIVNNCKKEYNDKLKINKMLFYLDFYQYKCSARSLTGMPYRAITYGPVPTCYDDVFTYFEADKLLTPKWTNDGKGGAREIFNAVSQFDESIFSDTELATISTVIENFKNISSWEIVELSHQENGWLENKGDHKKISYQQHAFDLKAL